MLTRDKNLVPHNSEETLVSMSSYEEINFTGTTDTSNSFSMSQNSNGNSRDEVEKTQSCQDISPWQESVSYLDGPIQICVDEKMRSVAKCQKILYNAQCIIRTAHALQRKLSLYCACVDENKILGTLKADISFCESKLQHYISYEPRMDDIPDEEMYGIDQVQDNAVQLQLLSLRRNHFKNQLSVTTLGIKNLIEECSLLTGSLESCTNRIMGKIEAARKFNVTVAVETVETPLGDDKDSCTSSEKRSTTTFQQVLQQDYKDKGSYLIPSPFNFETSIHRPDEAFTLASAFSFVVQSLSPFSRCYPYSIPSTFTWYLFFIWFIQSLSPFSFSRCCPMMRQIPLKRDADEAAKEENPGQEPIPPSKKHDDYAMKTPFCTIGISIVTMLCSWYFGGSLYDFIPYVTMSSILAWYLTLDD